MKYNPMASTKVTSLASTIQETHRNWRDNRKNLDLKWEDNRAAFLKESTGRWKVSEGAEDWQSRTFIGVTKQKVIGAYAIMIDMMLTGGEMPFMLKPRADEAGPEAEQAARIETKRLNGQLAAVNADRALMRNVMSACLYGCTWAKRGQKVVTRKGYRQEQAMAEAPPELMQQYARFVPYEESEELPTWEYVPVWDIYYDMEADDPQDGAGVIHRRFVSPFELRSMRGKPMYIDEAIDAAIAAGKTISDGDTSSMVPKLRDLSHRKNNIQYMEFWGRVPRKIADEFEADLQGQGIDVPTLAEAEDDGDDVEIMACVAGDQVVRYARTEARRRPFCYCEFERVLDELEPKGIADNIAEAQSVLNGAIRAYEDNKKLSANVILGIKERMLSAPLKQLKPGMTIPVAEECQDVRQAIMPVVIPDIGESLLNLIATFERYIDEESMIPKISQGLNGIDTPDTAYETSQLLERSGKQMGSVLRNFDEMLIEPMIAEFHRWNMEDPAKQEGKGDFKIQALGFSSFQNREIRVRKMQMFLGLILSSELLASEFKVGEIGREIAKALDVDPDQFAYSEEEKQQMQQAQQQDPIAQAQAAQLQANIAKTQAEAQAIAENAKIEKAKLVADTAEAKRKDEIERARLVASVQQKANEPQKGNQ